jgi:mono/diheme cytochrome c family protein
MYDEDRLKRTFALTLTALLGLMLAGAAPPSTANDDHQTALAALADIEAVRAEIIHIEDSQVVGHGGYLHAAHRALNAVVGSDDKMYAAADGTPGDASGVLGNVDRLLDRRDDEIWTPAMQGAKANLLAVIVNLNDAMHEKQMEDYETDLTEALANLALVSGRPSEDGVLGGLTGALANTSLGVPPGAKTVSGCTVPSHAPVYGIVSGRLAYVALPRIGGGTIPLEMSVSRVVVNGDAVVLYTQQANHVAELCRQARQDRSRAVRHDAVAVPGMLVSANAAPSSLVAHNAPAALIADATSSSGNPASYTVAQAHAGQAVFSANCIGCHGANLQGVAGPAVAGTEFLTTVKNNKWTLADLRSLVVENMPLNNPGTLTPEQYANVMAFLLASNCYPAGSVPFPQKDDPSFASIKVGPVPGAQPTDPKLGTCAVK